MNFNAKTVMTPKNRAYNEQAILSPLKKSL